MLAGDKTTISWDDTPGADRYQLMRGDLVGLRTTGGAFGVSLTDCLADSATPIGTTDGQNPGAGFGFYYLVRAVADCLPGTADSGGAGEDGRDDGVDASPLVCP